eukprot:COSAG05_NODE_323_length_11408_cov_361.826156_5_plen_89_part_00
MSYETQRVLVRELRERPDMFWDGKLSPTTICLSVCLSVCLSIYLSVCRFVCLFRMRLDIVGADGRGALPVAGEESGKGLGLPHRGRQF